MSKSNRNDRSENKQIPFDKLVKALLEVPPKQKKKEKKQEPKKKK